MRSMPGASPHRPAEPLVRRMGSLRVRVALRTEAEAVDGDGDGDSGGDRDRDLAMPAISVVASTAASPPTRRDSQERQPERDGDSGGGGDGDQGESRREQRLLLQRSAAMDFLPQEAAGGQQSPQPPSERLAGFCGVSLFHVGRLKLPDTLCGDRDRQGSPCFLVLCCRTASASASSGPKRIKVPYPTLP